MGTWIIVGLVIAAQIWRATRSARDGAQPTRDVQRPRPQTPEPIVNADKRYAEIQEEIRRRIAQRMAGNTAQSPVAPMAKPVVSPNVQRPPLPPVVAQRRNAPVSPTVVPVPSSAFPQAAAAKLISTPATYNTKSDWQGEAEWMSVAIGGPSKSEIASAAFMSTLRVSLASPSAARQAFILKEILGEPVGFRRAGSGGHGGWV